MKTPSSPSAPGRRWKAALGLVAVSVLVGLGIGEAALRAVDFSYYWAVARHPDPVTGWSPPPGVTARQDIEGRALVRINGRGLRDRDHALEKPPGTLRIAVLGDSFAEAVQVPAEETFWATMERELAGCEAVAGRPVEVLNFGVSGYSTAQALLTLRDRVLAYRPDLVILAFFAGNDVTENSRELDRDPMRPYFVLENGQLSSDMRFRESLEYRWRTSAPGRAVAGLVQHSRLAQAAIKAWDVIRLRFGFGTGEASAPFDEPGVDERVYREPEDPAWRRAWAVTDALVVQTAREARESGADFFLVALSTGAQVHPDPEFRAAFMQTHGIADLLYPEERLRALGLGEGFATLGLARELGSLATVSGAWLHGFANSLPGVGHWNRLGHRVAGDLLANTLCRDWAPTRGGRSGG